MFLYHKWLELSIATRAQIAQKFGIEKKGATHVENNVIKNDGYVIKDIEERLNVDALQKYLVTDETDMAKLFDMLVQCIEHPIPTLPDVVTLKKVVPIIEKVIKRRIGRPKGSKSGLKKHD